VYFWHYLIVLFAGFAHKCLKGESAELMKKQNLALESDNFGAKSKKWPKIRR